MESLWGVLEFLRANYGVIAVLLLFVLLVYRKVMKWIRLFKEGKKKEVLREIYLLVAKAEKRWGSKTGIIKYQEVISGFYNKFPWYIRLLFTQEDLEAFINKCWEELKEALANGEFDLLSYEEEQKK